MNNNQVLASQLYSIPDDIPDEIADKVIEDWESFENEDEQSTVTDNINLLNDEE